MPIPRPNFRGLFFNPDAGLVLPFMLNPQPITINKSVNWQIEDVPGLQAPVYYFVNGGQKTISFELFYDGSDAAVTGGDLAVRPPNGVEGFESIIESFLYPQQVSLTDPSISQIVNGDFFSPPPLCFLILGLRFWRGYLMSAPFEEKKFDENLTATQFTTQIEFGVVEDGFVNQLNNIRRNTEALAQSGQNVVDFTISLL